MIRLLMAARHMTLPCHSGVSVAVGPLRARPLSCPVGHSQLDMPAHPTARLRAQIYGQLVLPPPPLQLPPLVLSQLVPSPLSTCSLSTCSLSSFSQLVISQLVLSQLVLSQLVLSQLLSSAK
jgi:hypothetical protein